jgi:hypothetical protein
MKNSLILRKFKTYKVPGTMNMLEEKSFFGSKMLEIEDDILIDNSNIQYSQYYIKGDRELSKRNGFQYYDYENHVADETIFNLNLIDLKDENQSIKESQQNKQTRENSTIWEFNIDVKDILLEYLFAKLKESRVFKSITYNNLLNKDINESVYYYISNNILDRYKFLKIDMYILYLRIDSEQRVGTSSVLKYNPAFTFEAKQKGDLETNMNVNKKFPTNGLGDLLITYNQTKSSKDYKFNYYFDIYYQKI